jgi:hypothetical protein
MHIFIFYVVTQSFVKNGYFMPYAKKTKTYIMKRPILVLNFVETTL